MLVSNRATLLAGQLGDGSQTETRTPVVVEGLTSVSSMTAGYEFTCAVATNGTVSCWGSNLYGRCDTAIGH